MVTSLLVAALVVAVLATEMATLLVTVPARALVLLRCTRRSVRRRPNLHGPRLSVVSALRLKLRREITRVVARGGLEEDAVSC